MSAPAVRPPTVTLACTFLGIVSGLWLIVAGSYLTSWTDLQTQEQVREALADSGLNASLDTQVEILRVTLLVSAAAAVAAVILALYALRGHGPSRILLTIEAVLLTGVFGAMGGQGFIPAALAIACIVLLWNRDARAWFAQAKGSGGESAAVSSTAREQHAPPATEAAAADPAPDDWPAAQETAPDTPAEGARLARRAAVVTVVGSTIAVIYGAALFILGTWFPDVFESWLRDTPGFSELYGDVDPAEFVRAVAQLGGLIVALCILGYLSAALVVRRRPVGRTLLYIASGATIAMTLLTLPLGLITAGLAIWVIVLLSRSAVREWLAGR